MRLEDYIKKRTGIKSRKYRTINLDEDLHLFLKRTANHYDIAIADLMYNILESWKKQYQNDIRNDMSNPFDQTEKP
uniref:hypothetical protein n=1 Tax=Fulvivirga sp. TaxID=1931237 RepID=UPI00404B75DF